MAVLIKSVFKATLDVELSFFNALQPLIWNKRLYREFSRGQFYYRIPSDGIFYAFFKDIWRVNKNDFVIEFGLVNPPV